MDRSLKFRRARKIRLERRRNRASNRDWLKGEFRPFRFEKQAHRLYRLRKPYRYRYERRASHLSERIFAEGTTSCKNTEGTPSFGYRMPPHGISPLGKLYDHRRRRGIQIETAHRSSGKTPIRPDALPQKRTLGGSIVNRQGYRWRRNPHSEEGRKHFYSCRHDASARKSVKGSRAPH